MLLLHKLKENVGGFWEGARDKFFLPPHTRSKIIGACTPGPLFYAYVVSSRICDINIQVTAFEGVFVLTKE